MRQMLRTPKRNIVLILSCFLLMNLSLPSLVFAEEDVEEDAEEKGKIKWDLNRIMKDDKDEERIQSESEKAKLFPELFTVETYETIHSVQQENNESIEELQDSLFSLELEENNMLEDTKESLFSSDYTTPTKSSYKSEQEEVNHWLNNLLVAGLVGIGVVVLGGIFVMFRQLSE